MKPIKKITEKDYIKANRIASREEEIENHGHPVCHKKVHKSKKIYDRKRRKADDRDLPFTFVSRPKLTGLLVVVLLD